MGAVGPVEAEGHCDWLAGRLTVVSNPDGYRPTRSHGIGGVAVGVDQNDGLYEVVFRQTLEGRARLVARVDRCGGSGVGPGGEPVDDI